MRKKLLLMIVVAVLAVSIPVTIALIHQAYEPSNGGTADVPTDTPTTDPTLTILSMTEGNILVMKAGTDNWIETQVGMSLKVGDTIKSGSNSSAEITFFDGSTIELDADTQVEVASLNVTGTGSKTIGLKQTIGTTISRVTKLVDSSSSYEIETPACVAAVRGSVMIVDVIADGTTWVTNSRGDIWVITDGVELQIPEGRKCIVISGQLPQLVPTSYGGGGGGGGGGGFSPNPDIEITKLADRTQAHEGDTITYTYTVDNPGNVPLSSVSVTDDRIEGIIYQSGDTDNDGTLDTNETWIFAAAYNVTADDDSPLVNTAAAAGTYAGSATIIDWDTASVDILRPAIALDKTASPTEAYEGDTITYTYTITNAGNTPLSAIFVTDNEIEDVVYQSGDANEDEILDMDESWIFTADYITNVEDAGPLVNTATAYGTDALEWTVESEEATASVDILRPAVALDKTADPTEAYEGDTITYTYTMTNAGNTPLSAISVTDDEIEDITYQSGDTSEDEILDLDETWVFAASYTITAEDTSPLVNTATTYGTDALGRQVNAQASASVTIIVDIPTYGIKIELTWDTDNTDMDAHLIRPLGRYGHEIDDCHWLNENPDWGLPGVTEDNPSLNGDFLYGYGPEIITLEQPYEQGTYRYKVNYQNDHGLGPSIATVRVWINDAMVREYSKEMSNEEIWDCCSIDWPSGEVTPAEG